MTPEFSEFSNSQEKITQLPEIVIPDNIRKERKNGIRSLLDNPPHVDCMHVLGRSGTLATTGIYDNAQVIDHYHLPPLFPIEGIGNEVWLEWKNMMREEDLEDEIPEEGIGEFADDGIRQPFMDWVISATSPRVQSTIAQLRSLPRAMRNVALLDDITQSGNVAVGIAPAYYKAAYGTDFQYNPENNRYIFKSNDWIDQIIKATFHRDLPDKRQTELLVELSKGTVDWPGFKQLSANNIHSLDQLAHYCATQYLGQEARNIPPETVYDLIQKYGLNLFRLHEGIKTELRRHTAEIVQEK